jgi:hypothetical protein
MSSNKAPVSDAIIVAVARLVDDAQSGTREPSHSDLEFQINRAGLSDGDPKGQRQVVGKAKRVRATLSWGIDNAPDKAEAFVAALIGLVRGKGGFCAGSSNFTGEEEPYRHPPFETIATFSDSYVAVTEVDHHRVSSRVT